MNRRIIRNRWVYLGLIILTIIVGLYSRTADMVGPQFLIEYSGDVLWALVVFWTLGFILNRKRSLVLGFSALLFSLIIELSQIYHAPWIDLIRSNKFGGMVLGFGFKFSDLVSYFVGVMIGVSLEYVFRDYLKHSATHGL